MKEAVEWVRQNNKPIDEFDCPKFDMKKPIMVDLIECGCVCSNHWGCHTWRHIMGTRDPEDPNVPEVIQFT